MERNFRIAELIIMHLNGSITPIDRELLNEWRRQSVENEALFLNATTNPEISLQLKKMYGFDEDKAWHKLIKNISPGTIPSSKGHQFFMWAKRLAVAAVLAGLVFGIYRLGFKKDTGLHASIVQQKTESKDKSPGRNGALLILDDGRQLQLDSSSNGILATQGGSHLTKKGGSIFYENDNSKDAPAIYNTMVTPRGRQYNLTLSDGTIVFLNSASSIRFPVSFSGGDRQVEISGEAYFEVAKNPLKPFKVLVNKMEVDVLGTDFNVNAYPDEDFVRTTLLDGAVRLKSSSNSILISPGQQASYSPMAKDAFKINSSVDLDKVMAWKRGIFEFDDTDLAGIMRQISRWYDVDIVYESSPGSEKFGGAISKQVPLSNVLNMLEGYGVKFSLEGSKLTVKP